jgi:glycosyltransferase involved in cell wall biosynthesis
MSQSDSRPPISAYIRALNEERMIGEVVRAALLVAREVIVVDSGSTDGTQDIARAAGAKIIEHEWMGWGRQKRVAEDACQYDWLLDLDADEVVTPDVAEEIKALFAGGEPPHPIYKTMLALAPPVGEPWFGFGLQTRHKLYDRRVIRARDHDAWDQFILPDGVSVGVLRAPFIHYAFTGAEHLMDKLNRNSSIPIGVTAPKPKPYLALRIVFGLPFYVGKRYILQQYFRGGVYGYALAMMYGYARWLTDVKMWERIRQDERRSQSVRDKPSTPGR